MESATKFAILFPEGPGYLFVEFLGSGVDGVAVKVRSLADGKVYVRKKTVPRIANDVNPHRNPEVSLYRSHPNIPRLVYAQTLSNVTGPREDDTPLSDSMIFDFCNGPTLFAAMKLPEFQPCTLFKWKTFDQLLGVLEHLHRNHAAVGHQDLHLENLYLHFPEDAATLPDVYVGDFGQARPIDPSIWKAIQGPDAWKIRAEKEFRATGDRMNHNKNVELITADLAKVSKTMAYLITGIRVYDRDELENMSLTEMEEADVDPRDVLRNRGYDGSYPKPLWDQWKALDSMVDKMKGHQYEAYELFATIRHDVSEAHEEEAERVRSDYRAVQDLRWIARDFRAFHEEHARLSNDPELFDSRARVMLRYFNTEVPGPWRVAKVDASTFAVLEVSKFGHYSTDPKPRGLPGWGNPIKHAPEICGSDAKWQEIVALADELDMDPVKMRERCTDKDRELLEKLFGADDEWYPGKVYGGYHGAGTSSDPMELDDD